MKTTRLTHCIAQEVAPRPTRINTINPGPIDTAFMQTAQNLHEREITRGWLKASLRALDEKRSKSWKLYHDVNRSSYFLRPIIPS